MRSLWYSAVHALARTAGRTRRICAAVTVTALVAGLAAGAIPAGAATATRARLVTSAAVSAHEPTASVNDLRNGWDPHEPKLTPAVVSGANFGQVFRTDVDGQVYAQPLVVGNIVIVVTENDWVYGLNAKTGAILWKTSLGTPYHITSCSNLTPNIGDTSTPVYNPATGSVYIMALVKEVNYEFHLFGVNVHTGAITLKKRIAGSPSNDRHISFNALQQNQRPGLLLMHGWVYAAFASYCDHQPYAGFVAGVQISTHNTTLWTDEAGVSDDQAGIWQSGGGLMSDGPGRIIFTSGNGVSPAKGPGNKPPGQLAESVVRLAVQPDGSLQAKDFFSPANAPKLDAGDHDFGAAGPVGLPFGTAKYPHILAQGGKYGRIYLLNRNDLGGRQQNSIGGDQDLFEIGHLAGLWGHPAIFGNTKTLTASNAKNAKNYLYYLGKDDYLRAFKFGVDGSDQPTLTDQVNSTFTFGFGSGSPVVTSNGTDAKSAIVWVVDGPDSSGDGKGAFLGAFDVLPQPRAGGGTKLREIWSGSIGTAAKFSIAATDHGMVYVGTRDGRVYGFGITSGAALKRSGTATFRDTPVHSTATAPVTVTATRKVTVTGASVQAFIPPDPFTIGRVTLTRHGTGTQAAVKFPVTLHKGDTLQAQVKFAPGAPGGVPGAVSFATRGGAPVSIPLIGDGLKTGLMATPTSLQFVLTSSGQVVGPVPLGIFIPETANIVNSGSVPVTVTSVTAPSGPFSYQGLPTPGTVIKPGQALSVGVAFDPARVGPVSGTITVRGNLGPIARIALSGTGTAAVSKFTSVPSQVNFGHVRVGHTAKIWIRIFNRGNQSALMSGAATQGAPFHAQLSITKGLPVNATYDLTVPITFTPRKAGPFHGVYKVSWTDRLGRHTLSVPISGTGVG